VVRRNQSCALYSRVDADAGRVPSEVVRVYREKESAGVHGRDQVRARARGLRGRVRASEGVSGRGEVMSGAS